MMIWKMMHPQATLLGLGYIPGFLSDKDPRPAATQFAQAYIGGWTPLHGFLMLEDGSLGYPGDPPLPILAEAILHDETIRVYDGAWVAIVQPDGSFEVARMD